MRNVKLLCVQGVAVLAATLTFSLTGGAQQGGLTYAIRGAKVVTVSGGTIDNGTVLIRDGVIQAVGTSITVPSDAVVTDGAGLTVYPGFIDMASAAPLQTEAPAAPEPAFGRGGGGGGRGGGGGETFATREEAERAKRAAILRPDFDAAQNLVESNEALNAMAQAGITSVLAVPTAGIFKGQSALVNTVYPPAEPMISTVAAYRRGLAVVKAPVAQHVNIGGRGGGTGYPNSLLGTIAFTRQGFLDAQWQRDATAIYEKTGARGPRPMVEPALDALRPALAKQMPVAFDAQASREIDRSLIMATDFGVTPIIVGGSGAASRIDDLKKAQASVILSVNFQGGAGGGGRGGGGGGMTAMQALAEAPKTAARLAEAGIPFAFTAGGVLQPSAFLANVTRTVKEGGLPAATALRALTLDAARLAGAADRLGSIEQGKIANIVVMEGELFEANARVRHVFIDGRPIVMTPAAAAPAGRGGRGGAGR
ncbi:MAG: amidohydrolase family protein [Acidobacteria bacterium]|nr:amidohydrolase family protein [Acidobacteriota bacterium]